ncbi:MAG: hypothetical protein CL484_05530 [Acidobacteria bacterium]|nr:hypothetical protein [Acidobacteriota bacterium]|tara:strand:+ start:2817 stop:3563 length:747 start_codon:yes stop_codon:yes gene_type:complete
MCLLGLLGRDVAAEPDPKPDTINARVNFGWRPTSRNFGGTNAFQVWEEQGSFHSDYEISGGGVTDAGLEMSFWKSLGVGLDISSYKSVNSAKIASRIPHPFFFDLPRSSNGTALGLTRQELGMHLHASWTLQPINWLELSLSGGPSLINARQDLVSTVEHTETGFPFDSVQFSGYSTTTQSETTLGWNTAVDVRAFVLQSMSNRFLQRLGVGLLLRYMRGSVSLAIANTPVEVDLGGLQVTSGIRFRF